MQRSNLLVLIFLFLIVRCEYNNKYDPLTGYEEVSVYIDTINIPDTVQLNNHIDIIEKAIIKYDSISLQFNYIIILDTFKTIYDDKGKASNDTIRDSVIISITDTMLVIIDTSFLPPYILIENFSDNNLYNLLGYKCREWEGDKINDLASISYSIENISDTTHLKGDHIIKLNYDISKADYSHCGFIQPLTDSINPPFFDLVDLDIKFLSFWIKADSTINLEVGLKQFDNDSLIQTFPKRVLWWKNDCDSIKNPLKRIGASQFRSNGSWIKAVIPISELKYIYDLEQGVIIDTLDLKMIEEISFGFSKERFKICGGKSYTDSLYIDDIAFER